MTESTESSIQNIDVDSVRRLCSGQVIISLAIAVKELVENALDAQANRIEIKLRESGSKCIEVVDDGIGISQKEFDALGKSHHTSKIRTFEDLSVVHSFGFRGEALSSLATVAHVEVHTWDGKDPIGTWLLLGGATNQQQRRSKPRSRGTTETRLLQMLTGYCLISQAHISCYRISNAQSSSSRQLLLQNAPGGNLLNNIRLIFNSKQAQALIPIATLDCLSSEVMEEYGLSSNAIPLQATLTGYVSSPLHGDGRSGGDRQYFFINQRPCDHQRISRLIAQTYRQFNKDQSPAFCLNLHLPRECIDVNVVPDKRQIFLEKEQELLAFVKCALLNTWNAMTGATMNQSLTSNNSLLSQSSGLLLLSSPVVPTAVMMRPKVGSGGGVGRSKVTFHGEEDEDDSDDDGGISYHKRSSMKRRSSNSSMPWLEPSKQRRIDTIFPSVAEIATPTTADSSHEHASKPPPSTSPLYQDKAMLVESPVPGMMEIAPSNQQPKNLQPAGKKNTDVVDSPHDSDDQCPGSISEVPQLKITLNSTAPACLDPTHDETPDLCIVSTQPPRAGETLRQTYIDPPQVTIHPTALLSQPLLTKESSEMQERREFKPLPSLHSTRGRRITVFFSPEQFRQYDDAAHVHKDAPTDSNTAPPTQLNLTSKYFSAQIDPKENVKAEEEFRKCFLKQDFGRMDVIGQFNLGFIIARLDMDLFIVDQHASDEKYNFEQLQLSWKVKNQPLLRPLPMNFSAVQESIVLECLEAFQKNGFEFDIRHEEPVGDRFYLKSIPMSKSVHFGKADIEEMIFILHENKTTFCRPSRVRALLASRSCRKSIMIGRALKRQEMKKILLHMSLMDQPWNCPHGRPTMRHCFTLKSLPS